MFFYLIYLTSPTVYSIYPSLLFTYPSYHTLLTLSIPILPLPLPITYQSYHNFLILTLSLTRITILFSLLLTYLTYHTLPYFFLTHILPYIVHTLPYSSTTHHAIASSLFSPTHNSCILTLYLPILPYPSLLFAYPSYNTIP